MSTEDMEDPPGLDGEAPARGEDDPDGWIYRWAAWNVDVLTAACLEPEVREILERWREGSGEAPWTAAPGRDAEDGKDGGEEKGEAA